MSAPIFELQLTKKQSREAADWFDKESVRIGAICFVLGEIRIRCPIGVLNPCIAQFRVVSETCGNQINKALASEWARQEKAKKKGGGKCSQ